MCGVDSRPGPVAGASELVRRRARIESIKGELDKITSGFGEERCAAMHAALILSVFYLLPARSGSDPQIQYDRGMS